ncbi:right-handed parallel beta-helix repeat-containing protein [Merismopedia glauca]|nr:right-handed parallel beta-helix repeat-containing protein [Merismopedia glauca]
MLPKTTFSLNWGDNFASSKRRNYDIKLVVGSMLLGLAFSSASLADSTTPDKYFIPLKIVVNSPEDGDIKADDKVTLREAIALVNNTLSTDKLTSLEQAQVQVLKPGSAPKIHFNLPSESRIIYLEKLLPNLESPRLIVDGTTQPEYQPSTNNLPAALVVSITSVKSAEVPRGLTLVADGITIKGLSIYGFTGKYETTSPTPSADIFISHRLPPPDTTEQTLPADYLPFYLSDLPPKDIVITDNWLGIKPDGTVPEERSAFGIYVFNSLGTQIERNLISQHNGSGIITSVRAENLQITQNKISHNGLAGMPDAIRLEGFIYNTKISENSITNNDGSGIFIFKAEGSVEISKNYLNDNGKRLKRAAIYLTGNEHKVFQNTITNQSAAGVVVASYPRSRGNLIQNNRFANLGGLSIDLNTQDNVGVRDWQQGDGPNPERNSRNRRLDTGNAAINTPQFLASEFYILNGKVNLDGVADPGSVIEVYRTQGDRNDYNPLFKLLKIVRTNELGKFSLTLDNLSPGEKISAVAIDPQYGTSEPAADVVVRSP